MKKLNLVLLSSLYISYSLFFLPCKGNAERYDEILAGVEKNNDTARRRYGETARRRYGVPARQRDGDTACRRDGETAIRRDGETARRRYNETAIRRDGDTARRRYGDTAIRRYGESANRENGEIKEIRHNDFPDLDGIWLLTKKTIRRRIDPVLIKPVVLNHCNSRMPFEKRDFKKNVVIGSLGQDQFTVRSLYPVTNDIYYDPNQDIDITYENFGFKAIIDPEDLTYAYTLKLKDHKDYQSLSRQVWLNGRLKYETVSRNKIVARGYEIEQAPECEGFLLDEIVFEFIKGRPLEPGKQNLGPLPKPEKLPEDVKPILYKQPEIDTAKPKDDLELKSQYKELDADSFKLKKPIKVPALW